MEWLAVPFVLALATFIWLVARHEEHQCQAAAQRIRLQQAFRPRLATVEFAAACGPHASAEVTARVCKVLATVCESSIVRPGLVEPEKLRPDDDFVLDLAYHLDSLALLELVFQLEKEFDIDLANPDLSKCRSVRAVVCLVTDHLSRR